MTNPIVRFGLKKVSNRLLNKQAAKGQQQQQQHRRHRTDQPSTATGSSNLNDAANATVFYGPDSPDEFFYDPVKRRQKRKNAEYYHKVEGIPLRDAEILVKVKKRAKRLDAGLHCCGFRVGYGAFIALIPGIGDIGDLLLSYLLVYRKATTVSTGKDMWTTRAVLVRNLGVGFAVGLVPILGAGGLAVLKVNWRSAKALEEMLLKRARARQNAAAGTTAGSRGASRTCNDTGNARYRSSSRGAGPVRHTGRPEPYEVESATGTSVDNAPRTKRFITANDL